jgi:hypothetical protein
MQEERWRPLSRRQLLLGCGLLALVPAAGACAGPCSAGDGGTVVPAGWSLPGRVLRSGAQVVLSDEEYTAQTPDAPWGLRTGATSTRHELRAGEQWSGDVGKMVGPNRQRSELRGATRWDLRREFWLAFSVRVTGDLPRSWSILGQLHQRPEQGEVEKPPPLAHVYRGRRDGSADIGIVVRGDPREVTDSSVQARELWSGTAPIGSWLTFVHRLRLDPQGGGELDTWLNGARIVRERDLVLGYEDAHGPYWKIGIYRQGSGARTVAEYADVAVSYRTLADRVVPPHC